VQIKNFFVVIVVALSMHVATANAVGTLVPAANRVDMAHDARRGLIYITDGGDVLRYQISSASFLAPISLGGQLMGIDLSPDGSTLAVADSTSDANNVWVNLVALDTLAVSRPTFPKALYEAGTFAVAFGADGGLLITSRFGGSGWVPMRRLDLATNQSMTMASGVRQDTMVSASGDLETIAFAESNISDGRWGLYDVPTGQLVNRQGYTDGTAWFNFEIATNATGTQFAIPTYDGAKIYDGAYTNVGSIGQYAGALPIGVAYHPVESLIYFPWSQTKEVRVYNSVSLAQVGSYDFENDFGWVGNFAFQQGRTRLSRDGSLLMVSVTGGVRFLQMYAPLAAAPVSGTTNAGVPIPLGFLGSIGNAGKLTYELASDPTHGNATVNGNYVLYTPAQRFVGTDTFDYRVNYGMASARSTVSIKVTPPNRPPVAVGDKAVTRRDMSVAIPVLANDSDPDGDVLTITMATTPSKGTVVIQDGSISYTPPPKHTGRTSFNYTISDGRGGSATATVTVTVKK
jgi:hypothetical protein